MVSRAPLHSRAMQANAAHLQESRWLETQAVSAHCRGCTILLLFNRQAVDDVAGPDSSAPAKTYGASELTGGKTGGIKDLTGGPSSSISDLTGSKEGDKSDSGDSNKGGLFSGITGSGKETGFSGLTGGKTGGVSDITGQETGGIGDLVDRK